VIMSTTAEGSATRNKTNLQAARGITEGLQGMWNPDNVDPNIMKKMDSDNWGISDIKKQGVSIRDAPIVSPIQNIIKPQ